MRRTGVDLEIGEKLGGGCEQVAAAAVHSVCGVSENVYVHPTSGDASIRSANVLAALDGRTTCHGLLDAWLASVYPPLIAPLSLSLSLLFYILSSSIRRLFHSAPRERERDRSQFSGVNVRARERLYPPGR